MPDTASDAGAVTYAEVAALVNAGKLDEAESMESLLPVMSWIEERRNERGS